MNYTQTMHSPPIRLHGFTILFLTGFFLASLALTGQSPPSPVRHVVVVHSYHQGFSWTDTQNQGITAGLAEKTGPANLDINIFHLDNRRFPDKSGLLWKHFHDLYDDAAVDLIVSTDNLAFDLLKADAWRIARHIPLVFAGVNNFKPETIKGLPGITGVTENFLSGRTDTIALAARLHPGTRKLVFLMDTSPTSLAIQAEIEALKPGFGDLEFLFMTEEVLDRQLEIVAGLQPGTLLIPVGIHKDQEGNLVSYEDAMEKISAACPVPSYGFIENRIGHGMVGGKILAGFAHGREAGLMAARILAGEDPARIPPVLENPGTYVFDARQLDRFGIKTGSLPPGSEIRFRKPGIWEQYSSYIIIYTLILLGLGSLAGLLVLSRDRLKRTRSALQYHQTLLSSWLRYSPEAILVLDSRGKILTCNPGAQELSSMEKEELEGKNLADLMMDGTGQAVDLHLQSLKDTGTHRQEFLWAHPDGLPRKVMVLSVKIGEDSYLALGHDITAAREAEQAIQHSLKEKETLLRELYHRTKNNLNLVYSLLILHAEDTREAGLKVPFLEMATRIQAMSLIHEKLWQSRDLSAIPIKAYVHELIRILLEKLSDPGMGTTIKEEVDELELSLETMTPLALVLTELLGNAICHGGNKVRDTKIRVSLRDQAGMLVLEVEDDGPGFPWKDGEPGNFHMGLQSALALVRDQLQGSLEFRSGPGLLCRVSIHPLPARQIT